MKRAPISHVAVELDEQRWAAAQLRLAIAEALALIETGRVGTGATMLRAALARADGCRGTRPGAAGEPAA